MPCGIVFRAVSADTLARRKFLTGVDGQNLAPFVITAGRAGRVRSDGAAALRTLIELWSHPTMRGFARAQPHLRRFTFWNSHTSRIGKQEIGKTQILEIELIERAPIRLPRFWHPNVGFRGAMGGGANSIAFPVATRIRGQIQQDVLSNEGREIDRLRPGELGVEGELRHANRMHKTFKTGDARQLDCLRE